MRMFAIAALCAMLFATPALPHNHDQNTTGHDHSQMHTGTAISAPEKAYMDAMRKMDEDMGGASMSGDPTEAFVRMMIPHHQGAFDMAEILLKQVKVDPAIRKIAEDIVRAQKDEIATFRSWLASRKP